MNIIVADTLEPEVIEQLRELGTVLVATKESLPDLLMNAEILVVRSATQVDAALLSEAKTPHLKIVARAGNGLDNIDMETCTSRGIEVVNTPAASMPSVAEHALGIMLALARNIVRGNSGMKEGKWLKKDLVGTELSGKTLGIIGFGQIGKQFAKIAGALGMHVVYYDPFVNAGEIAAKVELNDLLAHADFVSLHAKPTAENSGLMNSATLSLMKKTAFLINTSRASLVVEEDLRTALVDGKIAGAGLDVHSHEPYEGGLCTLPNVILTPHIAANTIDAQRRIGNELVVNLQIAIEKIGSCQSNLNHPKRMLSFIPGDGEQQVAAVKPIKASKR